MKCLIGNYFKSSGLLLRFPGPICRFIPSSLHLNKAEFGTCQEAASVTVPPAVSVPSSSPAVEQKHRGMDALFCCVQLGDPSSTWWWLKTFRERDI
uniref:Secreted protein n=1 Tax=Globodera rostochiensis TaxID=31243 RepID=A0A914HA77_GLORO